MEVILTQVVQSLGKVGDVVKVKDGYGRNHLIPKKLAYLATSANLKKIEIQEKARQVKYEKEKQELLSTSARLAYPIRDDIPVMLENEARALSAEELTQIADKYGKSK